MTPDHFNALFELGGALILLMNIHRLRADREVKGVAWQPNAFFTAWGVWNLFYYSSLGQSWSFLGACAIVAVNAVWLGLVCYYWLARRKADVSLRPIPVAETVTQ